MSTLRYLHLHLLLGVGLAVTLGAGCGAITGEPLGGTGGHGAGGTGGAATGGTGTGGRATGGIGAGGTGGDCVCNAIYDPVCGVDGVTYPSDCSANCFGGVAVAYRGACVDGGMDGGAGACNSDSDCVFEPAGCCGQTCVPQGAVPLVKATVVCNVACPVIIAETCGCVNHQCATQSGTGGQGGGTGGTGGASCGDLATQYAVALTNAEPCDVNASSQCLQAVISSLSPCGGCATYVDDASALNALQASWQQQGCNNLAVACPAIFCPPPGPGVCVASDGGGGRCQTAMSGALPL